MSIFGAVDKQLELKLEARKIPQSVIFVDSLRSVSAQVIEAIREGPDLLEICQAAFGRTSQGGVR